MYDLLFLRNAGIGKDKCGTVMLKLVFFITNDSCNMQNVGNYNNCQKAMYVKKTQISLNVNNKIISYDDADLPPVYAWICEWCFAEMTA